MCICRTSFFRLYVGGYWTSDGSYIGGDIRRCRVEFENPSISMLVDMVQNEGFADNMRKFSYFSSKEDYNRKELSTDIDVAEMINCIQELESMNLNVVRDDDPYLEDVLVGEEEEEDEEEPEDEPIDFYRDDYAETDDSDDDGHQVSFFVGQAFLSKESCKKAIEKYAIKEKVNIRFQKSESKKVAAVCVQDCCSWRIYASVNSRPANMVVRSYNCTHTCYPTGVVKLYSAPKIAADFLNEFRTNQNLSADQMMQRLLIQGLRPVNGMELWKTHTNVVVMPPPDRIMPGRPKNNDRIREPTEALPSQVLSAREKVQMVLSFTMYYIG